MCFCSKENKANISISLVCFFYLGYLDETRSNEIKKKRGLSVNILLAYEDLAKLYHNSDI